VTVTEISEICIKSLTPNDTTLENVDQTFLLCNGFNFNDLQLLKTQIEQSLKNMDLYLIYSDGETMDVMFSSLYFPEQYTSYGKKLNINNNEENIFFEAYSQKVFDWYVNNNTNQTDAMSQLTTIYPEVKQFYDTNIHEKLIEMIQNYKNTTQLIDKNNYLNFSSSTFLFSIDKTYVFDSNENNITLSEDISESFYLLPIPVSFDYSSPNKYKLLNTEKTNFYVIITEKTITVIIIY
jgi:hypothetical protein